jgi:N-methylhydantoinase B
MTIDVISLEVIRQRLDALCEDGADVIGRTAISPVVSEGGDYSLTALDASGGLITGGGKIRDHFYAATNSVTAILAKCADSVAAGDVFLANDPHNGGGLHQQDIIVCQPVFTAGQLVAWVAASAHMMDMGGMAPGSFAPSATECYQESIRFPPVRLIAGGIEQTDIFDILKTNVRVADLVEMDLRGLIASVHVASRGISALVAEVGVDTFSEAVTELCAGTARAVERRLRKLVPGSYIQSGWVEWGLDELHPIVCTMTIDDGKLTFDYTGSGPQSSHYHNTHPFIIKSEFGPIFHAAVARDLPYNRGVLDSYNVVAPRGTLINAMPPAPTAAGHMDLAFPAVELALRALASAIAASPDSDLAETLVGPTLISGTAMHTWAATGLTGEPDAWLMLDSTGPGMCAVRERDGVDVSAMGHGKRPYIDFPNVEVIESWYPLLAQFKRIAKLSGGAGQYRAGAPLEMASRLHGTPEAFGFALGGRTRVPQAGTAGGFPGSTTRLEIVRQDGTVDPVPPHTQGFRLDQSEAFVFSSANGGGWGDPLDRDPRAVEKDVRAGRISSAMAEEWYGVIVGDAAATTARRAGVLEDRLRSARPARRALAWHAVPAGYRADADPVPLALGVAQQGGVAISIRSGAPLALAPHSWTDGCPVLEDVVPTDDALTTRAYLDPATGHILHVDVVSTTADRSFDGGPLRWTKWRSSESIDVKENSEV